MIYNQLCIVNCALKGLVFVSNRKNNSAKRVATVAILIAVAFVLSWIELILSITMPIPGIKIGLANLAILFTMYYCGEKEAFMVLVGRLVLNAVLFGNVNSLIYSVAGGLLSFVIMAICKKLFSKHIVYVSITGGVFHNIGQLTAASIVMNTFLSWYMPYLIIGGILAGLFNGIVCQKLLKSSWFKNN